ncbi:LamG domain-containing protein [Chondromyces crocatus]|uniref:LamG-like jellyroll fold domain-containing protein n=1 Tax=Chondromyces crocatus TaxID=52 RepID=A0A0K1EJL1_CHOCO|nr:LamG domain-containing protein [Chondromyces crocatus]AKT40778.1 uncharacterized protein CMC5_049340 [Chondromyces crocatus]
MRRCGGASVFALGLLIGACVLDVDGTGPRAMSPSGEQPSNGMGGAGGGTGGAGAGEEGGGGDGGAGGDAPIEGPFCDANDPTLVACHPFDDGFHGGGDSVSGPGRIEDRSGRGNHLVDVRNARFEPGRGGKALRMDGGSYARIDYNPSIDFTLLTVELWVQPAALPAPGQRMGLVDSDLRFGLFVNEDGIVDCHLPQMGGVLRSSPQALRGAAWSYVACMYDGNEGRLYIDGARVATAPVGALPQEHNRPIVVGGDDPGADRFHGLIDRLRLFDGVRSERQICLAALRPACPSSG